MPAVFPLSCREFTEENSLPATVHLVALSVPLLNELRDSRVRFRQRLFIWQKHNAEMLRPRFLPEARSVDDHDMLLPDEFLHKDFIALGNIDLRGTHKSAARRHATHARRRFTPVLREVAPGRNLRCTFDK